ncbi:hypothetical protein FIBSPDRAFT_844080 [Athelia psychrophila]|uniref:Uncharacterized protein n=1 Tax=Athelia psychrophila TaxID=1759441 RepID=A0A167UUM5_9AGAM|nr:hypothetical protein FIBSPDRAFT_844080 [Fibularhizoctonia sp. CBS 109695]
MSSSASNFSNLISGAIAGVTPVLALLYSLGLFLLYRFSQKHPRKFKTAAGLWLQRYFPAYYAFLVFFSFTEIALAAWLLLQYNRNTNYPNMATATGVRLLLFTSLWTIITAGVYTFFFLHPDWYVSQNRFQFVMKWRPQLYTHPIASVGGQAVWLLIMWVIWVSSTAALDAALPRLFAGGTCLAVVYCGQVQTLFGEPASVT